MPTTSLHPAQAAWNAYARAWSETDPAARLEALAPCVNPACLYTDPLVQLTGHADLCDYMALTQEQTPGVSFVTTGFISHHERSLAHWHMVDGEGRLLLEGASYLLHDSDGRLNQMNGFFQPPQAG